ncbi:MAG: hypothetical protein SFY32_13210 [Bacteroidota bacterium]|nr:hypothetical protein [Bacteroidota bacterium]
MNKTNVDEMLLQMIEPKVMEIQQRFSSGQGLSTEDINTLLLKSQYNHINHLDEKLNEVTADVSSLKSEFKILETELKLRMDSFEKNIEFKIQKAINSNMRWSIGLIAVLVTVLKLIDVLASKMPNIF